MAEKNQSPFNSLLLVLYIALLASVIFSFRAITSIAVAVLPLTAVIKNKVEQKVFVNHALKNIFFLSCCLLFLYGAVSLMYTTDTIEGWKDVKGKTVLVAIPFALYGCNYLNDHNRRKILVWYCVLLFAACLFAIYTQFKTYHTNHDPSVFFYHALVSSYSGHAIQFSILVFVALVFLLETLKTAEVFFKKPFHVFLIAFFSVFLFFLSSKLVIVFYIGYFMYYLVNVLRTKALHRTVVISCGAVFIMLCIFIFGSNNVISRRFNDVAKTDFHFLEQQKFSTGQYFNGLEFRLLQWKFVPQILNEKKAWFQGVTPGDAQACLNQKYVDEGMYTGEVGTTKKGFLGYNTHNEFLEALLQTGVVGLFLFLLICISMIRNVLKKKAVALTFITALLLAYSFTESVLESQYSIFIFLFFPLFFYVETKTAST